MERFLFTDGLNGVKEVQSLDELQTLIDNAPNPGSIKIWLFSSNEWISYAEFRKIRPLSAKKAVPVTPKAQASAPHTMLQPGVNPVRRKPARVISNLLYVVVAVAVGLLIFNFTRIKWNKEAPVAFAAPRPANVPPMDIDSLISVIEYTRGQTVDRNTRANLRLRNTWPERIILQAVAQRETNNTNSRFFDVDISIDNTTGSMIDNAIVRLSVWNNGKLNSEDTMQFKNIPYDQVTKRMSSSRYKGDSISIAFQSIRAKAFNFCYSAYMRNDPGDYNDRWFCR